MSFSLSFSFRVESKRSFSHFQKLVVRKYYTFHQKVGDIDQNVPLGNLSETFPKARNLTQALTNNNLIPQGSSSGATAWLYALCAGRLLDCMPLTKF